MFLDILKNKVIARFAFGQMRQAIFKLLKEKVEDALIFACRQKRHDLSGQSGRSMIEMLGVLAIIGVLSVGGLVGYSKAMERYRVNETMNQISYIVHNTRDLFKTQPNLYGSMDFVYTKMSVANYTNRILADKTKLFPTSLVKNGYKNMFGGNIYLYSTGGVASNDNKAFILGFVNIPQEACIEIVTRDWQSSLGLVGIKVRGSVTSGYGLGATFIGKCTTEYEQGAARFCAKDMPVTLEQATAACDLEKANIIYWKFY